MEKQHEAKQRRVWAVNPTSSAVHRAVAQGELPVLPPAMAPGGRCWLRSSAAARLVAAWEFPPRM